MSIPKINDTYILAALNYIDENGVPFHHSSTKYELVTEEGKRYPPKYVIAVADHLENHTDISTNGFNAVEAKSYLQGKGYNIQMKQEKFELVITSDNVISTNDSFSMNNIDAGDKYKPLDVYFTNLSGEEIRRNYNKGERKICNQTLPRLAFQLYETQISKLSVEEREAFPVCRYTFDEELICGIFNSESEFRAHRNSIEYMRYQYGEGRQYYMYCWNVFSTIIFVQECLKRFGSEGDKFVLIYREKDDQEVTEIEDESVSTEEFRGYRNAYSSKLIESRNIIFRGAPGTGKSYLAKEIATDIVSNGYYDDYTLLTDEQKQQIEFVQFHPSYDYSDFVEGLRPKLNSDGSIGFELQDGVFKRFIEKARKNYENSQKSKEDFEKETSVQDEISNFFSNIEFGKTEFKTVTNNTFTITNADDNHIYLSIPGNANTDKLCLNIDEITKMLESGEKFEKVIDITRFFGKSHATQGYSYDFAIFKAIKSMKSSVKSVIHNQEKLKKYIFIIDEINRGEISKIFGELFFSIDPGYRGKAGEISTQYSSLHSNPDDKFYIPENVYIIGTMNDIDRSVDSFDFAMRRRFRFIEIKADDRLEMLAGLDNEELAEEAIKRMSALNKAIVSVEDLNENYQIGASYFLKLKTLSFDQLWTDYLKPLLQDYVHGMYDESGIMKKFAKAYGYTELNGETIDESADY